MDYTSLIGPAVVAAVIAGLVSVISLLMNRSTTLAMHSQRLAFDREQAERKFEFDTALSREQAQRRVDAELALAERKFEFDTQLS
jgi:hypothetical protein